MESNIKGKGNGTRKAYDHISTSGIFGVADKIKEQRKNGNTRRKPRNSK